MTLDLPEFFQFPASDLAARSPVPVTVLADVDALHAHLARAIADTIASNNSAGLPTRLILPVGPIGHIPLLVELCNRARISWAHCHIFFMDEYCDWQGRWVDEGHPLSFRGFVRRALINKLDSGLTLPTAHLHFPDPRALDRIEDAIAVVGGIDCCYGGIGVHGHVAFNEAPISRWYEVSVDEFKSSGTRLLPLADETVVMNGARGAGGYFPALPPMAVTLGMRAIRGARSIRLYCQGGSWQRAVLRVALFGSPRPSTFQGEDVQYPVTLLRDHPDFAVITETQTAQPPIPALSA